MQTVLLLSLTEATSLFFRAKWCGTAVSHLSRGQAALPAVLHSGSFQTRLFTRRLRGQRVQASNFWENSAAVKLNGWI